MAAKEMPVDIREPAPPPGKFAKISKQTFVLDGLAQEQEQGEKETDFSNFSRRFQNWTALAFSSIRLFL